MIDETNFKKIATVILVSSLMVLAFFVLRPIILSTVFGLILSFIFYPFFSKIFKYTKRRNLSAFLVCFIVVAVIAIPLFFIIPMLLRQVFEVYTLLQRVDLLAPFKNVFPSLFSTPEATKQLAVSLNTFTSSLANSILNGFGKLLLEFPTILLHSLLILFVFFFGLRDGEKLVQYIQGISPLSKESERKVFQQFSDITYSVIFGQIIVGILQGVVTGIGLFIFQVPNALTLTFIATLVGILPIIGPWLVWVPVDIYLFLTGQTGLGIGLFIYGFFIINWIDTIIRPLIVSKSTKINSAVILVSMIGGLFVFGILGLILGPLIISYLLLLLEFYKSKKTPSLIRVEEK